MFHHPEKLLDGGLWSGWLGLGRSGFQLWRRLGLALLPAGAGFLDQLPQLLFGIQLMLNGPTEPHGGIGAQFEKALGGGDGFEIHGAHQGRFVIAAAAPVDGDALLAAHCQRSD